MEIVDVVAMRFGDRPVPADLSALAAISSREDSPLRRVEIEFIEPDRSHSLLDHSYLNDNDRANPDIMANIAAVDEVFRHSLFVARDGDDNLYGYWLHPDEPVGPPAVVCYSNEGQFSIKGGSLTEVMISVHAFDDEDFATLAQVFIDAGVPITTRTLVEFAEPVVVTSPAGLHNRLYRTERAKRGLPDF